MNHCRKFNSKYNLALIFAGLLSLITLYSFSNYTSSPNFYKPLTEQIDTVPVVPKKIDSSKIDSSVIKPGDTSKPRRTQVIDTFNVKVSKDSLDAPVSYKATDSMVLDVPTKTITLYNSANVQYKNLDLKAYKIELDQSKQIVTSTFSLDTAGNRVGVPTFVEGENNMTSDTIVYNFNTQKGITKSTYTQQGEMFVHGEVVKKISENEYFALRGRFTTCDLDTPHFDFKAKKMKFINQKLAVSGPVHPEFEGVPIPVYLPFGFFPLARGRHSGILPPQFSANEQFGLGLEGLGYYKVLNDNFDVTLRSDIYSYGGYRLNITPTYRVRYRYSGTLNFSYQSTRFLSDNAKSEFQSNKSFFLTWSHTVDSKARPGQSFSASVNAGSSKYNQYIANNPTRNFQNQLNSSIVYTKSWDNLYNLAVSATHNQNNNDGLVNISLPNITFNVNTLYPLQPKEFVGESKWYHKLGIGLNTDVRSQSSFYDSTFTFRKLIDTLQWGAQHSIPIQLSLPSLGPLQVSPGISFQEKWYSRQFIRQWNGKKIDTVINKGFFSSRDISFSLGMNTALFGTYNFSKNSKVKALRHVVRPNVSVSYKPDMAAKDYYETVIDTLGNRYRFSKYDGSIFGSFSEGKFGGISFGIDNNLEMKRKGKAAADSTEEDQEDQKIRLIDGFGFTGGYNFMADSFKLSTIALYLRSTLFENINITAGATLDPYQVNQYGYRVNKYAWQGDKFSIGSITNANLAISTSFRSKDKNKDKKVEQKRDNLATTIEEQQAQLDYIRNNPAEFADFDVAWSVNLSYSLNLNRVFKSDYSGFRTDITSTINVGGDFNLTPKWKVGMNTYYDFKGTGIQQLTMFLSREMHCWQMSINVTPVGLYRFFNITINPKSSILRDLRVNRTRYFYGGN